jgi:two-component system nitrate/nitrite response regulator NarL
MRRSGVRTSGLGELAPASFAPPQLRAPAPVHPAVVVEQGPMCLVVPEIADGDGTALVRTLRRRESTRAVLLTGKAGRRELVVLLAGGVRGAITAETPGAVRIASRPAAPVVRPGPELTARELGVLRLVAEGRSNRQIGEELSLSALTVKSHLARISRKVGTGDRAEMVAYAIRRELLT